MTAITAHASDERLLAQALVEAASETRPLDSSRGNQTGLVGV